MTPFKSRQREPRRREDREHDDAARDGALQGRAGLPPDVTPSQRGSIYIGECCRAPSTPRRLFTRYIFQERRLEDFSRDVPRHGAGVCGRAWRGRSFWEGATRTTRFCEELLSELERRGLKLSKRVLWVTDGGGGIIKALKDRYGKKLGVLCTKTATSSGPNVTASRHTTFLDGFGAEQLQGREEDVAGVRALASRHRVGGGFTPRSARGSADPPQAEGSRPAAQEPAFVLSRACSPWFGVASAISRYRNSKMRQRWLAAVLLHCEQRFKRVKGYASIDVVVAAIDATQREDELPEAA